MKKIADNENNNYEDCLFICLFVCLFVYWLNSLMASYKAYVQNTKSKESKTRRKPKKK